MAYCTTTQVAATFRKLTIGASTNVTTTEVTEWIEEADAEIDGRIGVKYDTPVTGAESLKILRPISIALVVPRVRAALANHEAPATAKDQKAFTPAVLTVSEANKKLDMICEGRLLLSDATLRSTRDGVADFATDNNFENYFKRNSECPIGDESDQW